MAVNYAQNYSHPGPWDMDLPPLSMPDMLRATVERAPDAPLIDFMGRRYSYAEVYRDAQRFAAGLQARGIAKGERIGLFLPNVPIYPAAYYGAMMAGAVVVNFSPLYTVEELSHQVADSGTRLLVTVDLDALLPTALDVLDSSELDGLVVGDFAGMLSRFKGFALKLFKRDMLASAPDRADVTAWDAFCTDSPLDPVVIDPENDLALLQYTGGTTGTPKGAMLTHQNLSANARQVNAVDPRTDERDMILGVLPLFHVFANACVLNRTVVNGGCMALLPRFDAKDALATIQRVKATAMPGVPTMYQALLDHKDFAATDFSSLRACISGGAPLGPQLKERFEKGSGARLLEGYGLTESSGVVSTNSYEGEERVGTIGQPIPATEVKLIDKEDSSRPAPDGEPGELVVRGPQIMRGYWNRPDAAKDAFTEDGWLRTGDVAVIDADGFIKIVDRCKDMIAVGGFKVFPSQVENALLEHEMVKEALVIGAPDPYKGERVEAYVTLQIDDGALGADELRDWANQRLGKHERIADLVIRDDLPKTMIGKLDRKALKAEVLGEG
ncbi:long-chain-fatty-acid--CoA ligase [Pseudoblastomonas halimionae]|uniref:AMP-binding protein n=1 Tax=Alteriqipengyuania halimionae TaxID=1926630 RepID=A0A6I4U657_9SPHN|nr:long-chain fatty acid--CoA ligase [Alteriqipengyuania halimionae]MXP10884.1 AMP-binding protein [Alteriqipengyuania halimionae]